MQGSRVNLADGSQVLNMCANNCLGLCDQPRPIHVAKDTFDAKGYRMSSVRFICGTQDVHKQLEVKISQYFGMEDHPTIASKKQAISFFQYPGTVHCRCQLRSVQNVGGKHPAQRRTYQRSYWLFSECIDRDKNWNWRKIDVIRGCWRSLFWYSELKKSCASVKIVAGGF